VKRHCEFTHLSSIVGGGAVVCMAVLQSSTALTFTPVTALIIVSICGAEAL
jgi:hypothetical protein